MKKRLHTVKKICCGLLVAMMTITGLPQNLYGKSVNDVYASTDNITSLTLTSVGETEIKLYAMDLWAQEFIDIPSDKPQQYQINVKNSESATYQVIEGESVTVSDTGIITPKETIWYLVDMDGYTIMHSSPVPGYTRTKSSYNYGKSKVKVTADGKSFIITVEVEDYAVDYADEKMDMYIAENITVDMTDIEKITQAAKFAASYNYDAGHSSATGMIVSGGGDCWASTDAIIMFCKKLGYQAWSRNANKDLGAGSGHRNAVVSAGGKYYVLDAGYVGYAPRIYDIYETNLFSYWSYTEGIEVYQYDGYDDTGVLEIPEEMYGKKVIGIGEQFAVFKDFSEIILPDTLTYIKNSAFNSCYELTKLHIPANVSSIGKFAFTSSNKLTDFTCDENNQYYKIIDGVLYNKSGTEVIACPAVKSAELLPDVTSINEYSFYFNKNIKKITINSSVRTIGEGAFGECVNLSEVEMSGSELESLGNFAFCNSGIKSLILPDTLTEIGSYAFRYCDDLTKITIPENVTSIGELAFEGCENLTIYGKSNSYAETYAKENNIPFVDKDAVILGDANGDGKTDLKDSAIIKRYLAGWDVEINMTAADMDKDGKVTIKDSALIKRQLAG